MTKLIALLGFTSLLLQSTTASWVGPGAPPAKEPEEWAGPGKRADAANAAAYIPDVDGQNAHEWNKRAEPWDTPPPADSNDAHEWNKKTVREKNEADFVPDKSHDWLKRDVKRDAAPGDLIWTAPDEDSNDSHEWGKRKAAPAAADFEWGAPGEDSNDSHEWGKRQVHKRIDTFKIVEIRIEGPKEGTVKNAGLWERSALSDAVPGDTWKRDLDGIYGQAAKQNFALDSRGMVEAWMNPRSLSKRQCQTAGYQVCADNLRCCPEPSFCCPGSPYCKSASGDSCCGTLGTCSAGFTCHSVCQCVATGGTCCRNGRYCEAGYKCCSLGGCAEEGGECCSNGRSCSTGNICVISGRTGQYGCCTDLSCTAYVEGGTTVPLTPSPGPTQAPDPIETDVPDVPDDGGAVIYETYYLTIRWYYYSYYWTVRMATSTVTSTEVTTTTVVSVTDTDRDSASSSLEALSESVVEAQTTPEEATTARAAATQSPDETESESPRVTASGPETTSRRPLPTAAGGDEPPGGGSGAGGLQAPSLYVWMGALGAGLMGIGMVWL